MKTLLLFAAAIFVFPSATFAESMPAGGTKYKGTFTWVSKRSSSAKVKTLRCTGAVFTVEGDATYRKNDYGKARGRKGNGCYDYGVLWNFEQPWLAAKKGLASKCVFQGTRVHCKVKSHPGKWPIYDINFEGQR